MPTTFQKRQKEIKRREKQQAKAERRAQRKLAKRVEHMSPTPAEAAPIDSEPSS